MKNGILIPIDISKESNFYPDFEYISLLGLILPIKSYEPEKNLIYFWKKEEKQPLKVKES